MIANRFVEDAISLDGTEDAILSVGPGPRPGSARRLHASGPLTRAESLSNRVSFFIDDAVVRADSSGELRVFACPPSPRRGGGRTKVSRHHSDVSAVRKPSRLQRKRSASRRPLARHSSLDRDHQRTASVRLLRHQESTSSRTLTVPGAVQLPRKDLPPKERRRRIAVLVVFITCLFIVTCSVLAVIITLTHESFQSLLPDQNDTDAVRKQNEQHQNSLSRDEGVSSNGFFNASSNQSPSANRTASAHSLCIGGNVKLLVDRPDGAYCFREKKERVYYMSEKIMQLAATVAPERLVGAGTCFGKFTKSGKFHLHVTALSYLAPYAQYKIWVKPSAEQQFLYGHNVLKSGLGRITENTPRYQGVVVMSMGDLPLGFGTAAKSTAECKHADPMSIVCFHQADVGEYIRSEDSLT